MTVVDPGRTVARRQSIDPMFERLVVDKPISLDRVVGRPVDHPIERFTDYPPGVARSLELRVKRWIDLTIALVALTLLAPLLATLVLVLTIDSPGPAFYRRRVLGRGGKTFDAFKLRTMFCDGDAILATHPDLQARLDAEHKLDEDPRITRCGRWLRRLSLDELPQLWNVLRGEMSLVGPRPHALAHDNYYDELISNYVYRHHMKPGLTGWAQVNGFRGETPTIDLMEKRVEYDVWYVSNWSIWLDISIIFRTALALIHQETY